MTGPSDPIRTLVDAVFAEFCGPHTEAHEPDDSKVSYPEDRCHITFGMIRAARQTLAQRAEAVAPFLWFATDDDGRYGTGGDRETAILDLGGDPAALSRAFPLYLAPPPAAPEGVVKAEATLREALAYVGYRTDGDLATLAERADLWMRESRVLIDMQRNRLAASAKPQGQQWEPTPCPVCGGFCGDHGPTCAEAASAKPQEVDRG